MKIKINDVIKKLQKHKSAIRIKAFFMAGLLLAVNSFAWFTFVVNGNGTFTADVISWDIQFFDDEEEVEILDFELVDLYPGMPDFYKSITVKNQSDFNAKFSYKLEEITIYGKNYNSEDLAASLKEDFPFQISFDYVTSDLNIGESLSFVVSVKWPFEAINQYYKINSMYPYDSKMDYYFPNGTNYDKVSISSTSYNTLVKDGLYIESDDADTYWGEKSVTFKKEHPSNSSITLKLKLVVSQKEQE